MFYLVLNCGHLSCCSRREDVGGCGSHLFLHWSDVHSCPRRRWWWSHNHRGVTTVLGHQVLSWQLFLSPSFSLCIDVCYDDASKQNISSKQLDYRFVMLRHYVVLNLKKKADGFFILSTDFYFVKLDTPIQGNPTVSKAIRWCCV